MVDANADEDLKVKKPRGRPKKVVEAKPILPSSDNELSEVEKEEEIEIEEKKPRGRPKKVVEVKDEV